MENREKKTMLQKTTGCYHAQITNNNPTPYSLLPTPLLFVALCFLLFAVSSCENVVIKRIVGPKTVAFESNGGSRIESQTVFRDQPVKRPVNPVKSGFAFVAWYRDNNTFLQEWDFAAIPNRDITLYAKWDAVGGGAFTVIFDKNGGDTDANPASLIVNSGSLITAPEPPAREYFDFGGWYREADCITVWDFAADTVTAHITLYAKWTTIPGVDYFTVTFDKNGGDTDASPARRTVQSGGLVTPPETKPARADFEFDGWYKEADCSNIWDFAADTVSANITLYAKWTTISGVDYFTVTFDKNGGDTEASPRSREVVSGNTVTAPEPPNRNGYTFGGWYKEAACEIAWNFTTDTVSADTILYAKWVEVPVVPSMTWTAVADSTFGGTTDDIDDIVAIAYGGGRFVAGGFYGKMATSPDGVTWTAVANNPFAQYVVISAIAYGNSRFVAVGSNGKMAYSSDGITWTAVADSPFGTSWIYGIAYGDNRFVAVGNDGKMAYSTDGISWTAVENSTFGTTYNRIGAIAYGNNRFVAGGDRGKMAYSADGVTWTAISATDSPFNYADWEIEAIAYVNGKFVAAAGSRIAYSVNGINWTAVTNSTFDPSAISDIAYGNNRFVAVGGWGKMAYSADGVTWTAVTGTDSTFGTSGINAIAYGNNRFVAVGNNGKMAYSGDYVAQPATRTVTFDSNGGSTVNPLTSVTHGSTITAPAEPGRSGYTFGGWYKEASLTTSWNFATDTVSADITLYAKWVEITDPLGTADNPFLVNTETDLRKVGTGQDGWTLSAHYRQTANIPLTQGNWTRIGTSDTNSFTGSYNGDGHTITGLTINTTNTPGQGMFGYIGTGGKVENLGLINVNINSNSSTVGGIAGENRGGTIQNCYVTGDVTGNLNVGGIVGDNYGTIKNCVALNQSVTLTGTSTYVGRITGTPLGTRQNNYAWSGMTLKANNSPVSATSSSNGIHGADITAVAAKTQAAWQTAGFTFTIDSPWVWNTANSRPVLRNEAPQAWPAYLVDPPGTVWTAVTNTPFDIQINAIAYGNGRFVAGGWQMAYSADGVTWTAVTNSIFTDGIMVIAYGNNRFVAGGLEGKMAYSADGVTWTAVTNSIFGTSVINGIAYGNNMWVAVDSNGKMAYSSNGTSWTAVADSTFGTTNNIINAIAYGNNRFVAVGINGKMAYSTNGTDWTAVTGTDNTFSAIAYGNNRFVAGGSNGKMAYSTDGVSWTAAAVSTTSLVQILAIAYGSDGNAVNRFVAGGQYGMVYSADGITWTAISAQNSTFYASAIRGIAYGNNRFVAVGADGKMAYADWP